MDIYTTSAVKIKTTMKSRSQEAKKRVSERKKIVDFNLIGKDIRKYYGKNEEIKSQIIQDMQYKIIHQSNNQMKFYDTSQDNHNCIQKQGFQSIHNAEGLGIKNLMNKRFTTCKYEQDLYDEQVKLMNQQNQIVLSQMFNQYNEDPFVPSKKDSITIQKKERQEKEVQLVINLEKWKKSTQTRYQSQNKQNSMQQKLENRYNTINPLVRTDNRYTTISPAVNKMNSSPCSIPEHKKPGFSKSMTQLFNRKQSVLKQSQTSGVEMYRPSSQKNLLDSEFRYSFRNYLEDRNIENQNLETKYNDDISYKWEINKLIEKYCDEWPNLQQLYEYLLQNSNKDIQDMIQFQLKQVGSNKMSNRFNLSNLTDQMSAIKKQAQKDQIKLSDDLYLNDDILKQFLKNKDNLELPFKIKVSILEKQNNKVVDFFKELFKTYNDQYEAKMNRYREVINLITENKMKLQMTQSAYKENLEFVKAHRMNLKKQTIQANNSGSSQGSTPEKAKYQNHYFMQQNLKKNDSIQIEENIRKQKLQIGKYKAVKQTLEEKINKIESKIKTFQKFLRTFFFSQFQQGEDIRNYGIIWILDMLDQMNLECLSYVNENILNYMPQFLDHTSQMFILEMFRIDIQIKEQNQLLKSMFDFFQASRNMYDIPPLTFKFHQSKQKQQQWSIPKDPNKLDELENFFKPRCRKNQFEQTYEKGKELMIKDLTLSKSREKNIQNVWSSKNQYINKDSSQSQKYEEIFTKVQIKIYEDDKEIFRFQNRKEFLDQKMGIEKYIEQLRNRRQNMDNEETQRINKQFDDKQLKNDKQYQNRMLKTVGAIFGAQKAEMMLNQKLKKPMIM